MKMSISIVAIAITLLSFPIDCLVDEIAISDNEIEIVSQAEVGVEETNVVLESESTKVDEHIVTLVSNNVIPLGVCKLTAYCKENYPHICNNGDSTYTATMTTPTPGRTVAVDPKVIPYGSDVIVNGHTYVAEDCGGAVKGNRIDILFETHQEALAFGIQYAEVFYIAKGDV